MISKCRLHVSDSLRIERLEHEPSLREVLERIVEGRGGVLAIFDSLIGFPTPHHSRDGPSGA